MNDLEMIHYNFSCNCALTSQVKASHWEGYKTHESKIEYLFENACKVYNGKFKYRSSSIQKKCVMDRVGIKYIYQKKQKINKIFLNFKILSNCFYCMKK